MKKSSHDSYKLRSVGKKVILSKNRDGDFLGCARQVGRQLDVEGRTLKIQKPGHGMVTGRDGKQHSSMVCR